MAQNKTKQRYPHVRPPLGFQPKLRSLHESGQAREKRTQTGRKGSVCFSSGKVRAAPIRVRNLLQVALAKRCKRVNQTPFKESFTPRARAPLMPGSDQRMAYKSLWKLLPLLQGGKLCAAFSHTVFSDNVPRSMQTQRAPKRFFFLSFFFSLTPSSSSSSSVMKRWLCIDILRLASTASGFLH